MIKEAWNWVGEGSSAYRLMEKVRNTCVAILQWRRRVCVNSGREVKKLETLLAEEQNKPQSDYEVVNQYEKELKRMLTIEEGYWRAKSRVQWIREGDKNTKFFHGKVRERRRANCLTGIEDEEGVWREGDEEVARVGRNILRICSLPHNLQV